MRHIIVAFAAAAALWMTAGDMIGRFIPGMPHNSLSVQITRTLQHVHFSHYATGPMWLTWIVVMIAGWRLKSWGRRQMPVGFIAGAFAVLPLLPLLKGSRQLVQNASAMGLPVVIGGVILASMVFAAKVLVWIYWWRLASGRIVKN